MRLSTFELMHQLGTSIHASWRLEGTITFTRIQGMVTELQAAFIHSKHDWMLSEESINLEITMLIRGIRSCAIWQFLGDGKERVAGAFTASCVAMLWFATCHCAVLNKEIPSYCTFAVYQNSPNQAFRSGAKVVFDAIQNDFIV